MALTRDEALVLLRTHVTNENLLRHSLAAEAVMRALARRLGRNEEAWGLSGLLHDLDVELTDGDLAVHGNETARILDERGVAPEVIDAIVMHNERASGKKRCDEFQHALAAAETITGLITATALVYPERRLSSVKVKSVVKRMKERAFAASVNRDHILECEAIGVPLDEFAALALEAMRGISGELGL